jgi:hypothetical protein
MHREIRRRTLVLLLAASAAGALALPRAAPPAAGAPAPGPRPPSGSVTGRVVLEGKVPARKSLLAPGWRARVPVCCEADALLNQDLIVDPKTKGIANVVVFLPEPRAVHPALAKPPAREARFELKGCRFVPHLLLVRRGQPVQLAFEDPCPHDVQAFGLGVPVGMLLPGTGTRRIDGKDVKVVRKLTGRLPLVSVRSNLYPWMTAWWVVLDHPYGAVTDAQGRFTIRDLPAGEHSFWVWQEKAGWLRKGYKVKVRGGKVRDAGTIRVPASAFEDR